MKDGKAVAGSASLAGPKAGAGRDAATPRRDRFETQAEMKNPVYYARRERPG
ncbi:hypothetical protein AM571_PB00171 (plasmid) [Rhizobium etli 8C-3]|uniref:Uncharacterized protein n=1 Tax=Rhizobium etli 8C-3 TaxID=538025 RepID=A0A1L5PBF7_RHIET|nr:hypothetical protein AM571_PB00171 [Rhizobium etli 8C-3]ARQ60681.1 hypothetical protein Kim5_PA00210 [Rhizobium sp. Kim5]